jgi:ATP synthase protein I
MEGRENRDMTGRPRRTAGIQLIGLGLEFSGSVIGGLVLGYLLDEWLGTTPWLFLIGTFGGLGGAVLRLVMLTRHFEKHARAERGEGET